MYYNVVKDKKLKTIKSDLSKEEIEKQGYIIYAIADDDCNYIYEKDKGWLKKR